MTPSLPLELLQEILSLTLEGESPAARQWTRTAFQQVCRAWKSSVAPWRDLIIVGRAQLFRALVKLANAPAGTGALVRGLHLELAGAPGLRAVTQTRGEFDRLLSLIPNVQEVKHFALDGYSAGLRGVVISCVWLRKILAHWHALETFRLERCLIGALDNDQQATSIWSSHTNLHTVDLRNFHTNLSKRHCLANLPPSVRALSLGDNPTPNHPATSDELINALVSLAPQLSSLALTEQSFNRDMYSVVERGGQEGLLAKLAEAGGLESLAISVCAMADLTKALVPLRGLRQLELMQEYDLPTERVAYLEVINFLVEAPELRRLTLAPGIWGEWTDAQLEAVEVQAEANGVVLELIEGWYGSEGSDVSWDDTSDGEADETEDEGATLSEEEAEDEADPTGKWRRPLVF